MAEREDPLVGFHFGIEVQGVISGFFTECSGIGSEQEVIEHKVISESGQEMVMKLPRPPEVGKHHSEARHHQQHGHLELA
ncbi:MAG: hypothetical protein M5U34_05895 [Chloroflexi bacterium]|nr:hypothetical protein [Chloroflexota bacterium]